LATRDPAPATAGQRENAGRHHTGEKPVVADAGRLGSRARPGQSFLICVGPSVGRA